MTTPPSDMSGSGGTVTPIDILDHVESDNA